MRNARNDQLLHSFVLHGDQRARARLEGRHDAQRNSELAGKFDRSRVQDFGTEARQFEHFLEGYRFHSAGVRHDAGICCVNAIDIGADLTFINRQSRRNGHGRRI